MLTRERVKEIPLEVGNFILDRGVMYPNITTLCDLERKTREWEDLYNSKEEWKEEEKEKVFLLISYKYKGTLFAEANVYVEHFSNHGNFPLCKVVIKVKQQNVMEYKELIDSYSSNWKNVVSNLEELMNLYTKKLEKKYTEWKEKTPF